MKPAVVDAKLQHIVRKLVRESNSEDVSVIVENLKSKYREYQRKADEELTFRVDRCLQAMLRDDPEEQEYDEAAKLHDARISGSLNDSLRNRYRTQQQQQSQTNTEESNTQATAASSSTATPTKRNSHNDPEQEVTPNRKRKKIKIVRRKDDATQSFLVPRPKERYSDLGGMSHILDTIRQLVQYPIKHPTLYEILGIDPPRGVLLRGPPGTGKTHLANAIAGELGVSYFRVSAPELVSGMSGESEAKIRDLFTQATNQAPSIIFLDEIDAVTPKRSDSKSMEKRMVAQLLTSMDELSKVVVIAATNRPDSLDPALRRAGRFDKEIHVGVPDEETREKILKAMTQSLRVKEPVNLKVLARLTPGFVGADLRSLAKEAAAFAIRRIVDQFGDDEIPETELETFYITMEDFESAIPNVQPSSKREGFATVPDVSWDDIGALQEIREELHLSVLEPIRSPERFKRLGLQLPAGVLLYGPPGCGKTLLAKAIANESGANFISVKGPELLDKYVGESEKAVRVVFERARASSPCIVFFDELDSLVPRRGSESSSGVSERVVNQLLTELDGLESRRSVFVIAATNRPELIDSAMLRPGRLDKLLYVPVPTPDERVHILRTLAKSVALDEAVCLATIAQSTKATGFTGADCANLLREAGLAVLKEGTDDRICSRHFEIAYNKTLPSVSLKDQKRYERIRDRMANARCRQAAENNDDESSNP